MQVLGAGGAMGRPAHTGVNFGGETSNLGASPHDWGFAKKPALHLKILPSYGCQHCKKWKYLRKRVGAKSVRQSESWGYETKR